MQKSWHRTTSYRRIGADADVVFTTNTPSQSDPETVKETIEQDSRITEIEQDSLQLVVEAQLDEFNSS